MTKPSQIQIQQSILSLFTLHESRLLPPPTSSISLVVTAMCCLYTSSPVCTSSAIRVTHLTSLIAVRADLKQTALQVVLQLAYALRPQRAHLRFLSESPLRRRVQASVFGRWTTLLSSGLRVGTPCCHTAHLNCPPSSPRLIRPGGVAPSSNSSRHTRFCQGPQQQRDAQTTPLSHGVCANAAPQNQRTQTGGLQTKQDDCQVQRQR